MRSDRQIDLSDLHKTLVGEILAREAGRMGMVKVFGSRANGRAKPSSDLDLVIFPPASEEALGNLRLAFEESDLPIEVDVVAWSAINAVRLREEIERDGVEWPFADHAV